MAQNTPLLIPATKPISGNSPTAKKMSVAAYCRVSTTHESQASSYDTQIAYYRHLICNNPAWEFAGIFTDSGVTGTDTRHREGFRQMIAACQSGRINMILTKSISRFARNTLDCLTYIRELKQLGVSVYFERENINTMDATGELIISILGSLAQEESRNISTNIRWAIEKKFQAGMAHTPFLYGYEKEPDGGLRVNPETAAVVRQIFRLYLEGNSLEKIKATLEKQHIKSPTGNSTWDHTVIAQMLRNEKYTGDAISQKTYCPDFLSHKRRKNYGEVKKYYVKNSHPAIISKTIFGETQQEWLRRQTIRKTADNTKKITGQFNSKYALSGILVCPHCKKPFRRITWHSYEKPRVVWRCLGRIEHGKRYCPNSPSLDEQVLKSALSHAILSLSDCHNDIFTSLQNNIYLALASINNPDPSFSSTGNNPKTQGGNNLRKDTAASGQKFALLNHRIRQFSFEGMEIDDIIIRELIHEITVLSKNAVEVSFRSGFTITLPLD